MESDDETIIARQRINAMEAEFFASKISVLKKCPICTENKTQFTIICKHSICSDCFGKLHSIYYCQHPECRESWISQDILGTSTCLLQLICKIGLETQLETKNEGFVKLCEHTSTCPSKPVSCFRNDCEWDGYFGKMQDHFIRSHSNGTATYFVQAQPEKAGQRNIDHRILFAHNCFFDANFVLVPRLVHNNNLNKYRLLVNVALVDPRNTRFYYKVTIFNQHGTIVLDYKTCCLTYSESNSVDESGDYGFTCGSEVLNQFWGENGFIVCKVEICIDPPEVISKTYPQDVTITTEDLPYFCSPYESITYLSKPGHIYYDVIIRLTEIISSGLNVEFAARTLHDIFFDRNVFTIGTVKGALSEFFVGLALGPDNYKILLSLIEHQNYQVVQNASKITGLIIGVNKKLRNIVMQNKKVIPRIFSRLYEFKEGFLCEKSSYNENLKITESMCVTLNSFLSNTNKNQFCHFLSIEDVYPKLCFLYEEYTKRKHWEIVRELTDMVHDLIRLASRYKNKTVLKKLRQHGAESTVGDILYGTDERRYEPSGLCRITLKDIQRYFDGVYV